jgi:predicted secreted acid phosphatase
MRRSSLLLICILIVCIGVPGQPTSLQPLLPTHELPNLNDLQSLVSLDQAWFTADQARLAADQARLSDYEKQLIAYHDCTDPKICYTSDIDAQTDKAIAYLEKRIAQRKAGEKFAIVLDIDETSLSNWELERKDQFNYVPADWSQWYIDEKAPAIAGTLKLFRKSVDNEVDVFFITGRGTSDLAVTEKDLLAAQYLDKERKAKGWRYLYTRPDQLGTGAEYKSRMRADVETGKWKERIILNVGDQLSDLAGSPQAELSVKLPNPFYFIP